MLTKVVLISALLVAATTFLTCSKSGDTIVGPSWDGNLLSNSSFEINGIPSLQGWFVSDTSAVHFSADAPQDGGSWSISIAPAWVPSVYSISTTTAASEGNHRYELSLCAKKQFDGGWAQLILYRQDTCYVRKTVRISDSTWTSYTSLDTLFANEGDSLIVVLTGAAGEVAFGETFFDLVRLEKLD